MQSPWVRYDIKVWQADLPHKALAEWQTSGVIGPEPQVLRLVYERQAWAEPSNSDPATPPVPGQVGGTATRWVARTLDPGPVGCRWRELDYRKQLRLITP